MKGVPRRKRKQTQKADRKYKSMIKKKKNYHNLTQQRLVRKSVDQELDSYNWFKKMYDFEMQHPVPL